MFVHIKVFALGSQNYFHFSFYCSSLFKSPLCASDFKTRLYTCSIKKGKSIFSKYNLIFDPKVLPSCMANPFYFTGLASNIFWLFPKIKSTLKRRGHVNSEDARKNVLEALKMNPKRKFNKMFRICTQPPRYLAPLKKIRFILMSKFLLFIKKSGPVVSRSRLMHNEIYLTVPWGDTGGDFPCPQHATGRWWQNRMWTSLGKKPQRTRSQGWFPSRLLVW